MKIQIGKRAQPDHLHNLRSNSCQKRTKERKPRNFVSKNTVKGEKNITKELTRCPRSASIGKFPVCHDISKIITTLLLELYSSTMSMPGTITETRERFCRALIRCRWTRTWKKAMRKVSTPCSMSIGAYIWRVRAMLRNWPRVGRTFRIHCSIFAWCSPSKCYRHRWSKNRKGA